MNSNLVHNLSDIELARLVGNGDPRGQRELYDRYAGYLSAVARRYLPDGDEAKDVLQEAFINIFRNFSGFEYRGEGSLKAWMTRIVVNGALHALRDRKVTEDVERLPDRPSEDPEVSDIPLAVLQKMIQGLPDGYRTVFNLYVFEQMPHKQIASLLGIKESTSASQLLRAKALLVRVINDYRKTNDR